MKLRAICDALGAEVRGVRLNATDAMLGGDLLRAIDAYAVLLFRGQELGVEDLVVLSRRLGELDAAPVQEGGRTHVADRPEVYVVSNILGDDGAPIGSLGAGEATWHTDMSYLPLPPDFSLLHAIEVPKTGGDTWFCGMDAAFASLPDTLRQQLVGHSIKHDGTYNSGGYARQGVDPTVDPMRAPGAIHPIVCAHPRTGRPVLYLGRRRNAYIVGLALPESEALLDALWAHATHPRHVFAHRWRVGDVLLWDNRATMHRRDPFDANARRLMHRTQVKGVHAPHAAEEARAD